MVDILRSNERDRPREECGVGGFFLHPSLASKNIAHLLLKMQLESQHRGQESAGFCISDHHSVSPAFKRMGLITGLYEEYKKEVAFNGGFYGHIGIAHNRYSVTGSSTIENAGPFRFETEMGAVAVAHNGNITNATVLKSELIGKGVTFNSTTDSEVIGALIVNSNGNSWAEKIKNALSYLEGSFSLVISTKDTVFAACDKFRIRPLSVGEFEMQGKPCVAISSETAGFNKLNLSKVWDVPAGGLVEINSDGIQISRFAEETEGAFCGLEFAYFTRPDSRHGGVQMDTIRRNFGKVLAINYPIPDTTDFVTYIPESARPAAEGYARQISMMQGRFVECVTSMIKGRYGTINGTVRGFISPDKSERKKVADENYYAFDILKGKEICMIDDSIFGGPTSTGVVEICRHRVGLLKNSGVSKIHLRIVFPQVIHSCPYGVDIDETRFLVAKELGGDIEKISTYIGVDSLAYLTVPQFSEAIDEEIGGKVGLCMGCVTGNYPYGKFETNKLIFESDIK